MRRIGIGLLGFGTVGAGVVEGLRRNGSLLAERLGVEPVLCRIADLDISRDRGVAVDAACLTTNAEAVVDDPEVRVVVELIGGTGAARSLILRALDAGKSVVTANKALLAKHGEELFARAQESGADICFGASVGGGIPILRALREGLTANRIRGIDGILNGTCNYILTRMESDALPFDDALRAAQRLGFAEADPSLDIDGLDTAHKAVILASQAYGSHLPLEAVHVEGIRGLDPADVRYALDLGYRIKLMAVIRHEDAGAEVEVRVHPSLVPLGHVLASVSGVHNAVMVRGDLAGGTLYYGRGAGREPTASTVLADVADVVRNLVTGSPNRVPALTRASKAVRLRPMPDVQTRYYLRLSLPDRAGMLGRIATVLGERGISIASVLQKEGRTGAHVPVVIVTHRARERAVNEAIQRIDAMEMVGDRTVRLRIEE